MKKTDWFPRKIKPVHVGLYEVDLIGKDQPWFAFWDGKKFSYASPYIKEVIKSFIPQMKIMNHKTLAWRGLAEKPE